MTEVEWKENYKTVVWEAKIQSCWMGVLQWFLDYQSILHDVSYTESNKWSAKVIILKGRGPEVFFFNSFV